MKISEIVELSKEKTVADIAKDHLSIGEKTARAALKRAGCHSTVGKAGWIFDDTEHPENLDKTIYYFADLVKQEEASTLKDMANLPTFERPDGQSYRKRHSFDLDVRLVKELKLRAVQQDRQLYLLVEDAIRDYLNKDDES